MSFAASSRFMSNIIIDFHTHAFPEKIALKTMQLLSGIANTPFNGDGTLRALGENLRESGADMSVVLNIATNPPKTQKINDCAAENDYFVSGYREFGKFVQFGSVHPDTPDVMGEIDRIADMGLRGIKFHPDYQGFHVAEERMFPIYRKIASRGLIALFHGGFDPQSPNDVHCPAEQAAQMLERVPELTVVLAHMGGNICEYEKSCELLCGKFENLYLDTAFCAGNASPEIMIKMIERQGAERVLFGSDFPWHTTEEELAFIRSLGLNSRDQAAILGENAARLLKIDI